MEIDNRCLKKILDKINADYIVYGAVEFDADIYSLTVMMMDKKGRIVRYITLEFKNRKSIRDLIHKTKSCKWS